MLLNISHALRESESTRDFTSRNFTVPFFSDHKNDLREEQLLEILFLSLSPLSFFFLTRITSQLTSLVILFQRFHAANYRENDVI